jgi:uncharacterized protein YcbX
MKIIELKIYPIKSCAGISLSKMPIGPLGPKLDRQWMIVDASGKFVTQRTHPKMALIKTELNGDILDKEVSVQMTMPSGESFRLENNFHSQANIKVEIWGEQVHANDLRNDQINKCLSDYLNQSVKLVQVVQDTQRKVSDEYMINNSHTGFADGYPALLVGSASVEDISSKMGTSISQDRFRANIIIETKVPYEEEQWTEFSLGPIKWMNAKLCARCVMIDINPKTAIRDQTVLKKLAQDRNSNKKINFGINLIPLQEGLLTLG